MLKRVSANQSTFKTVTFEPGFNVVLADRAQESDKKDSRNGLGKSTLIEIIHFCLGAGTKKNKGLLVEALKDWEFSLDFEASGQAIVATRDVKNPRYIELSGTSSKWPIPPRRMKERLCYDAKDLNQVLGTLMFGIPISEEQYQPSFRTLISYFIRRGKDAFSSPFEFHRKQQEWLKQVCNAFLLNLAWEDSASLQQLKDRKKALNSLKSAAKAGVVQGFSGSRGDLEARLVRLKMHVAKEAADLNSFKVHPQYQEIQSEADNITNGIHELINANSTDQRLVDLYERSLSEEQDVASDLVESMYQEAGVALPYFTLQRLEQVRSFHNLVVKNRKDFLSSEIERLRREIVSRNDKVKAFVERRAELMEVLRSHGALEEYSSLQRRHLEMVSDCKALQTQIENHQTLETGLGQIKIEQEVLRQKARRDYDERHSIREQAISLFNEYSEFLYNAPGKLVLDVTPTGLKFNIEIEKSGSTGIGNMKIFCYDLMLARLWAQHSPTPGVLIHDSIIFDGVDERQRALALELAARESEAHGFQYICTLNSDQIPSSEFSEKFSIDHYVRLRLTDESVDKCLLGVQF